MTFLGFMHEHNEQPVKTLASLSLALTFLLMGCPRHGGGTKNDPGAQTQTIAPAVAQPAPTGTESMTQTVNVDDSRSEEDGGTSTAPKTASKPAAKPVAKKSAKKH
jgi:cell division septation protein DedD